MESKSISFIGVNKTWPISNSKLREIYQRFRVFDKPQYVLSPDQFDSLITDDLKALPPVIPVSVLPRSLGGLNIECYDDY